MCDRPQTTASLREDSEGRPVTAPPGPTADPPVYAALMFTAYHTGDFRPAYDWLSAEGLLPGLAYEQFRSVCDTKRAYWFRWDDPLKVPALFRLRSLVVDCRSAARPAGQPAAADVSYAVHCPDGAAMAEVLAPHRAELEAAYRQETGRADWSMRPPRPGAGRVVLPVPDDTRLDVLEGLLVDLAIEHNLDLRAPFGVVD